MKMLKLVGLVAIAFLLSAVPAFEPSFRGLKASDSVFGVFTATDQALMIDLLPQRDAGSIFLDSLSVARELGGMADASGRPQSQPWYLFPAPETLYGARPPETAAKQAPQHISPHRCVKFRRIAASATQVPLGPGQYPVLYSKKLHHLEPPYGIEP